MENTEKWIDIAIKYGSEYGLKLIMALVIWIVGKWIIKQIMKVFKKLLSKNKNIDTTLEKFLSNLCLLYTSPSPRDQRGSRMPSSA